MWLSGNGADEVHLQVDYFNKRRVLQARQDLMEAKAAEQRENGGPITGEKSVPVGGMGRK